MHSHNAALRIGFNQTQYSAPEEDSSSVASIVRVCINLFGTLERNVIATLSTMSGTAIGKQLLFLLNSSYDLH